MKLHLTKGGKTKTTAVSLLGGRPGRDPSRGFSNRMVCDWWSRVDRRDARKNGRDQSNSPLISPLMPCTETSVERHPCDRARPEAGMR